MTSLSIVLQTIAQFFLFLSVGYIAARLGVVRASFLSNTGGLIMKVLLPAMIFSSLCLFAGLHGFSVCRKIGTVYFRSPFFSGTPDSSVCR